jgi:hypothetical protein
MKKHFFLLYVVLSFSYTLSAKTHDTLSLNDLVILSQKSVTDAANYICANVKGFDRECFLIGTFDDNTGHYQTFTANKSIHDVNDSVKWIFNDFLEFNPDTMAYQRITTYGNDRSNEDLALLAVALFKKDHPDMRALRVCDVCCPGKRHYGSEIKSCFYDPEDSVCRRNNAAVVSPPYETEIYSSTLVKITADFFSYENTLRHISSGGNISYRGVIKRNKLSTKEQKISFLTGIFMRYGCEKIVDYSDTYSIFIRSSGSLAALCCDILKETGCEHVAYVDLPVGRQIIFTPSVEILNLKQITYRVEMELRKNMIIFGLEQ